MHHNIIQLVKLTSVAFCSDVICRPRRRNITTSLQQQRNAFITSAAYSEARFVRTQQGHEAAQPLYQQLLEANPNDITAASRIAAAPATPTRHDLAVLTTSTNDASNTELRSDAHQLHNMLTTCRYFNLDIVQLLGLPLALAETCAGPAVFLTPALAGPSTRLPFAAMDVPSALECMVAMFLLGLAVPVAAVEVAIGPNGVALLERLGLAFSCQNDPTLLIPYVHIFPLTLPFSTKGSNNTTLWLLTDLHPRVLSTTTVGTQDHGAVMYIGPDSLALFQNFITSLASLPPPKSQPSLCVDLCTGSGIQALAALSVMESIQHATVLDINPRALRFAHFNAMLNGLDGHLQQYILGDLVSGQGQVWRPGYNPNESSSSSSSSSLIDLLAPKSNPTNGFDQLVILANPPFLPVPVADAEIRQRYGLFSDGGGPIGERVLQAIVELGAALTDKKCPTAAAVVDVGIVSEFVNPPLESDVVLDSDLLHRVQHWWCGSYGECCSTRGILFTNEIPMSAETYAQRRADDSREAHIWLQHLQQQGISHLSPGLLYLRAKRQQQQQQQGRDNDNDDDEPCCQIKSVVVPKTESGSIWTPNNPQAVSFIHKVGSDLWN